MSLARIEEVMRCRGFGFLLGLLLCVWSGAGCQSWKPVGAGDGWSLYALEGEQADLPGFEAAFDPAMSIVTEVLGPFRAPVRVHVVEPDAQPTIGGRDPLTVGISEVDGIGPARIRAWHTRTRGALGDTSGIYMSHPDVGTAAHELVHARFAEEYEALPLWLEEGIACLIGDGFLWEGRWVIDGLSCWPLRELKDQRIADAELTRLLTLRAADGSDSRENVLVHFLGWAITFDLMREEGRIAARSWIERYQAGIALAEARQRLERTLSRECLREWLGRLEHEDPRVRAATAKGLWKLRSPEVLDALLRALEKEQEADAKAAMGINALACAGETQLTGNQQGRMWRVVWPKLRRLELEDPGEQEALSNLFRSFRFGSSRGAQTQLEGLRRFWAE